LVRNAPVSILTSSTNGHCWQGPHWEGVFSSDSAALTQAYVSVYMKSRHSPSRELRGGN